MKHSSQLPIDNGQLSLVEAPQAAGHCPTRALDTQHGACAVFAASAAATDAGGIFFFSLLCARC